jgi:hypothetical protein
LQFTGPFSGNPVCPHAAGVVLSGQQDNQTDLPRGQLVRNSRVESVLIVNVADQFDGFHSSASLAIRDSSIIAKAGWHAGIDSLANWAVGDCRPEQCGRTGSEKNDQRAGGSPPYVGNEIGPSLFPGLDHFDGREFEKFAIASMDGSSACRLRAPGGYLRRHRPKRAHYMLIGDGQRCTGQASTRT